MATATYIKRSFNNGEILTPIEIVVGMEGTYSIGGDCYPFEVVEVRDSKTVVIRSMEAIAITQVKNYGETPNYMYLPNPNGRIQFARLVTRNGRQKWCIARPEGPRAWSVCDSGGVSFGKAVYRMDPSF